MIAEATMELTIRLFANFRDGRFKEATRDVAPGTTLGEIADSLAIAREQIGVLLVNGRHAELEAAPRAGDTVAIFPQVGGG